MMPSGQETIIGLLEDIGDAIRDMTGESSSYTLAQMPPKIRGIHDFFAKGIRVSVPPTTTRYDAGDSFDTAGMSVVRYDKHGVTYPCSDYTVSPSVLYETDSEVTLAWTFSEMDLVYTTTQAVTVDRVPDSISVVTRPVKYLYAVGEQFDSTGLTVMAHYTGGTTDMVTGWGLSTAEGYEFVRADDGQFPVTVTYTENGATVTTSFNVEVDDVKAALPYYQTAAEYEWSEVCEIAEYVASLDSTEVADDAHVLHFRQFIGSYWYVGEFASSSALYTGAGNSAENRKVYARLIGVLHDDLASPSSGTVGKAGMTFMFKGALPYGYSMNASASNSGGWSSSRLRTARMNSGEIYDSLPSALLDVAVPVLKSTNNLGQVSSSNYTTAVTQTTDTIWAVSLCECLGTDGVSSFEGNAQRRYVISNEGAQYEYFDGIGCDWTSSGLAALYSLSMNLQNDGSVAVANPNGSEGNFLNGSWLARTAYSGANTQFYRVNPSETTTLPRPANNSFAVMPCFCVGDGSSYAE